MSSISVEVCFDAYYNLSKLCFNDGPGVVYWLSWNFLDKTYKSDEFPRHQSGPSMLKNLVKFDFPAIGPGKLIPRDVIDAFPFRVFLCTNQAVLAVANVNPFRVESVDKENITSTMPFQLTEWVEMVPIDPSHIDEDFYTDGRSASIKVSLRITSNDIEHDEYDGEAFETEQNEETEYVTETVVEEQSKRVHFHHAEQERKQKLAEQHEKIEQDRQLRHFRLSIDMRSISGLKRPAQLALSYLYPFLGSSSPVRTKPVWSTPHGEAKIDRGGATFEFAMSREQIQHIFTDHPLYITAQTKTNMGNHVLGEVKVDLTAVMVVEPNSFRCPLTSKSFPTLREYVKHREILLSLLAAGAVEQAPPREPVVVFVHDQYHVMTAPSPESRLSGPNDGSKATPNYITPLAEGGKLRVVLILEDIGMLGNERAIPVKAGYKMHNGAVYNAYGHNTGIPGAMRAADLRQLQQEEEAPASSRCAGFGDADDVVESTMQRLAQDPLERGLVGLGEDARPLTVAERKALEKLKLDWEGWRRGVDAQWREAMLEKETLLRKKLEAEAAAKLVERAEDLKRAQIEAGKLEVRLRSAIEEVERQKAQLNLKAEQNQMGLAQKTSELQLLQRRVRDEAKVLVGEETRRANGLQQQVVSLQESLRLMEKRAKDSEHDFEQYRAQLRNSPESVLREEAAKLRAQLGECRGEVERERRLRSETELEKEHFRAQMHRLALALKREREKSSTIARQELEQLRLEFLAREERYTTCCLN